MSGCGHPRKKKGLSSNQLEFYLFLPNQLESSSIETCLMVQQEKFPDQRIKLAKKLERLLISWNDLEMVMAQQQVALENLDEQLRATAIPSKLLMHRCEKTLSPISAAILLSRLSEKIVKAKFDLHEKAKITKGELDQLQRQFYQLKTEVSKSLPGIP